MKLNISDPERVVRFGAGAVLSSLAFWGPKKPAYLVFLIPMATGFIGTCPLYSALGISTRTIGEKESDQANDYFPVQSPSERAAGHPIVGAS